MKIQANDSPAVIVDKNGARQVGVYTQADLDRARADGYRDGFRHGKQSRTPVANKDRCEHGVLWSMECLSCGLPEYVAATPPDIPSAAAMRAAEEIDDLFDVALQGGRLYAEGFNRAEAKKRVVAIITRCLAAAPAALCRASLSCRSGEGRAKVELQFSELRDAQAVHKWLANTRNAAATTSPETAVGGEAIDDFTMEIEPAAPVPDAVDDEGAPRTIPTLRSDELNDLCATLEMAAGDLDTEGLGDTDSCIFARKWIARLRGKGESDGYTRSTSR